MTDDIIRELRSLRRWVCVQTLLIVGATLGFLWLLRVPAEQVNLMASFNHDLIMVTCDSSLYSKDEWAQRLKTPEQRVRLARVCQHWDQLSAR